MRFNWDSSTDLSCLILSVDQREGLELKMFLCACFMNIGAGHDTRGSGCYFSSGHQVFVGNNKG